MQTLRNTLRTLLAGAFAIGIASTAAAQGRAPGITFTQAEQIAHHVVPDATIESIELEHERGVRVYEVELRTADGVEHEVLIDANDGHVIDARIDD